MTTANLGRQLSRGHDGYMTPGTVEHPIGLIDGVWISIIPAPWHPAWDHTVGKCFQVNSKKLGPTPDHFLLGSLGPRRRRVGRFEQMNQAFTEFRRGCQPPQCTATDSR